MLACYLLLKGASKCAQLRKRNLEGIPSMMASEVTERSSAAQSVCLPKYTLVVWRDRATLMSVKIESVCGCTQIQRITRIPGSQKGVRGLILLNGELVPLLSLFGQSTGFSAQRRRYDEYALVLAVKGARFAVNVKGIPKCIVDHQYLESSCGRLCHLRTKHLERLFRLCAFREDRSKIVIDNGGKARRKESSVGQDTVDSAIGEYGQGTEQKTMSRSPIAAALVEEGVRWKRHSDEN